MNQSIDRINELPAAQAQYEFLKCCGSTAWAKAISDARPFANSDDLSAKADGIWWSLSEEDWLEAFRAHPKIGEKKAEAAQSAEAQRWSAQEQSESERAAAETKGALAEGNREYERRFGFIFIICATGKSAEEILAALHGRLNNDPATELRMAAEEQRKITQLRLQKLLEN
ncbi:MAG TPA: 2-oxo-4-hydroxy-4-carboxy-5-ureidoimidazoline decarboxylase [Pyrinomonadaceae bacterium]|nr:2-oxo-4-hydroxy-4-carboxy-5-ureidoimidazoline decarboxylase [Pyrinomonadaceae bacterium]